MTPMMMDPKKKKFGAPPISESDITGGGLKGAAQDVLEAIKDNDADALASALKLAYSHCEEYDEPKAEAGDEEDTEE